jgi:hypothetical protein
VSQPDSQECPVQIQLGIVLQNWHKRNLQWHDENRNHHGEDHAPPWEVQPGKTKRGKCSDQDGDDGGRDCDRNRIEKCASETVALADDFVLASV